MLKLNAIIPKWNWVITKGGIRLNEEYFSCTQFPLGWRELS